MMNIRLITLLLAIISTPTIAQDTQITPIHQFMQANADSTLILEFTSNWIHEPEYYLLSKKGDTLNCYIYKATPKLKSKLPVPEKIANVFTQNRKKIYTTPVGINSYFNIQPMTKKQVQKFWNRITKLQPWTLKDDSVEGQGCPAISHKDKDQASRPVIFDGGGIRLALITAKTIRFLDFYAPDFYEKECPGRTSRKTINKISALFKSNFEIK